MSATLNCAQCAAAFTPRPRRGKPQVYCGKPCQTRAANKRRDTTRAGRLNGITNPRSGQPLPSTLTDTTPSDSRALSEARTARISALMTLAHSRGGIDPWQIAELAKLKNVSPWAPLRVILGHKDGMK